MRSCEQMQAQIRELIALNMQRQERDNISAVAVCGTEGEPSGSAEDFAVVQEFCYTSSTELAESLGVPAE